MFYGFPPPAPNPRPPKLEVIHSPSQSREEQVLAPIREAINTDNVIAFKSRLKEVFEKDWELLKGRVLHGISMQGNNTVLHEAAMVKGGLSILKTICQCAPFLMGKTNSAGETVWHIAARQDYSSGVFETLYRIRLFWKNKLEAADTPKISVNGVLGGLAELSIQAANISHGNTALHEALLSKNTLAAKKLFYADMELCYMVNGANKTPMQLALEIRDAELFKSMFRYAASTRPGMSVINDQKATLSRVAFTRKHEDSVIDLIRSTSTSREETRRTSNSGAASSHHNHLVASAANLQRRPVTDQNPGRPVTEPVVEVNNVAASHTDHQVDPNEGVRLAFTYAFLRYARSFSTFKTFFVSSLRRAAGRVKDMKDLIIQPGYQHSDPKFMINQLLHFSIFIFFLTWPFTFITRPKFRPFFAINKLLWFIVFYGTVILAVSRHSGNMLGLTSQVLALYLKLVKLMMVLELIAVIFFLDHKYHLYTIGVTVLEWSYDFLL